MKILGDSQITNATITATNLLAASFADKLKTFPLADNLRTLANNTIIDLDFGTDYKSYRYNRYMRIKLNTNRNNEC